MINKLITGNTFKAMPSLIDPQSIDLIYVDPPFYTQRDFGEFNDKWENFNEYMLMIVRLARACHLALKPTGSLYLHCDPTASHYIKVELDAIFGDDNFRNEIIWCYTGPSGAKRRYPAKHDAILFYSKTDDYQFNADDIRVPYKRDLEDAGGGIFKETHNNEERLRELQQMGKIIEDWWADITPVTRLVKEMNNYPTQKPLKLLDRIIKASSNEGDLVLDPMCGSGTTLVAAKKLNRNYIGIDKNPKAIKVAQQRLDDTPRQPRLI